MEAIYPNHVPRIMISSVFQVWYNKDKWCIVQGKYQMHGKNDYKIFNESGPNFRHYFRKKQ